MSESTGTDWWNTPKLWRWFWNILVGFALLILILRVVDHRTRRGTSLPPLPQPNGYDTLLAVGRQVHLPSGDLQDLGADAVRRFGQTNQLPWTELRAALRTNTAVPLSAARGWGDLHAADVKQLKRLVLALSLQSRAELLQGNTNASTQCLVDVILLGHALARGGLFSDGVNGLTVETIGTAALRSQCPKLSAEACRRAARELEQAETRRETPDRILKTERAWVTASYGLLGRAAGLFVGQTRTQHLNEFTPRYHQAVRRTRQLMLLLACRAAELETGKHPAKTAELVPGILQAIPTDPVSNTPMTDIPEAN